MTDHELVKTCMNRIFKQLGFESTDHLTQRNLEYFCHEIEERSGILISLSTAKRLLNGQFSKQPQIATLNAIANYLGYVNWQTFRQEEKITAEKWSNPSNTVTQKSAATHPHISSKKKKIIAITTSILGAFILIAFVSRSMVKPANFKSASFSAQKTTKNNIPNTVIFHYNIDGVNADSFFIQQSWNKNRRVRVYKNQYTLTDIYYEPGYHTAKLIADEKIIKTFDVSIPTGKWFFYAKSDLWSLPEYIEKSGKEREPLLRLTKEDLLSSHIDISKEKEYIYTYFPSRLEVNSDNFVLKARVRRVSVKNNFCPHIMLEVFCQKNFMYFKTMPSGCSSEAIAQFGENFLSGKTNDLSSLTSNVNEWQNFELLVKDRRAKIFINGKSSFKTSYQLSSGLITGLGFISNGLCEVEQIELKGLDGKTFYSSIVN